MISKGMSVERKEQKSRRTPTFKTGREKTNGRESDCETDEGDSGGGVVIGANGVSLLKVFICPVKIILSSFYTIFYICCIEKRKTYCPQG